ncbi:hypothetical protein [Microvirga splendida]|uniref:Uncharacterized protein n=1 Tax=Microvirga splendida TaxID=2795727 RepID=A0ABS0Y6T3_9HYPH|nr:hypothetical protein [Microvirga splendida]MBJ6128014.1 hypothetical protein [Microvirga splendida]
MTYSGDRKALSRERANSHFKAARSRLQLILAGHWGCQRLEMRRYHRTALLRESVQQRKVAPRIPTPSGSEQDRAGGLCRFMHHNLE